MNHPRPEQSTSLCTEMQFTWVALSVEVTFCKRVRASPSFRIAGNAEESTSVKY